MARAAPLLLLIDFQLVFLEWERRGMRRNNPQAVENAARLLATFRKQALPIIHIRHESTEQASLFKRGTEAFQPMPDMREGPGETVLIKQVNSAFIGTDLEQILRDGGHEKLIICGITTNHCVETTTRMAGNLGFDATLVEDACYTFDRIGFDGAPQSAEAIHQMSLSNLNGEFASIATTDFVLDAIESKMAS